MKLLTWNIRHGGGTRLARIAEELAAHDADVIALTEYRAGPGKELCAELADRGWPHVATTDASDNESGRSGSGATAPRADSHAATLSASELNGKSGERGSTLPAR